MNTTLTSRASTPTGLHRRRLAASLAGIALVAAACGGSDGDSAPEPAPAPAPAAEPAAAPAEASAPAAAAAAKSDSSLGEILVGDDGLTLYGFTNDVDAASTCYDACADAWPPVLVDADWSVAPDLDLSIFATTTRTDGTTQLVAGKWPLYYFAGDAAPGDVNGQTSGDVWFAAAPDGSLIMGDATGEEAEAAPAEEAAPADAPAETVAFADNDLGSIIVDQVGMTLYGFTPDEAGEPTCVDACGDAWPPYPVDGDTVPAGLDTSIFSVVTHPNGTNQLKAGKWPLYYFAGDIAPGDTNGQGSGDVWFVAAADGSLIKGEAQGAAAPAESEEFSSEGSGNGY